MSTTASLQAFKNQKNTSENNETRILNFIKGMKEHGVTKKEMELVLNIKHQSLTSKLSSLRDQGKIYINEEEEPKDGCSNWYATPPHLIDQKAKERKHEKYVKWLKQGSEHFGISSSTINRINLDYRERNFH